jgi:hypothetical protein
MPVATILTLIAQYGPGIVSGIESLIAAEKSGQVVTLAQVSAIFSGLQPYSAFYITPPKS